LPRPRIEAYGSVTGVEREWEGLADRVNAPPFLRPGWIDSWWRAFGRGRLEILGAFHGEELRAVVALVRRGPATQSPTNWHSPLFGSVSADDEAAEAIVRAVAQRRHGWLDLSLVDAEDPIARTWARATTHARAIARPVLRSPYVELAGDWEGFEAGLPSRLRSKLAQKRRKLERQGELEVVHSDGLGDDLNRLLTEGFEVEGSGWKRAAGTAITSSPTTERFYREIARWAAERGWLRLTFLRLGGRAIAFDFALSQGGALWGLKGGFDPVYRSAGPGVLIIRETIARAYAEGLSTYEFLGADDPYKLVWTSTVRERVRLQAFPTTVTGTAGYLAWAYGRPLAKQARAWMDSRGERMDGLARRALGAPTPRSDGGLTRPTLVSG
jgi:CelD/BcsL family acetyltransferase involved in cellulose biosynthesis